MIPLKHECMLDIQSVMACVIINEVMDFLDNVRLYNNKVSCRGVDRKCAPKYSLENYATAYFESHFESLKCNSWRI
jgi:hypothetical protein